MYREQFEKQLADTKSEHESLMTTAKQEQERIQKEIEALTETQQAENEALQQEHERLVLEAKENEKV